MGTSHWFLDQNNFFLFFLLYFTPRGTTNNLPLLNTQNRPTLVYRGCTLYTLVTPPPPYISGLCRNPCLPCLDSEVVAEEYDWISFSHLNI